MSEQSIVYDSETRHLNRRAAIYSGCLGKIGTKTNKSKMKKKKRKFKCSFLHNLLAHFKKKTPPPQVRNIERTKREGGKMTQFLWPPREIGMLISIIKATSNNNAEGELREMDLQYFNVVAEWRKKLGR